MNFSWKIFTAFRIPVRLHFSMIIIPFLAYTWVEGTGLAEMLIAALLTILLFGSVLLHEFGHALTGRRYGVHTEDIVLTPIGGMARMHNIPQHPKQEIAISIAGPLVSFAIAGVAYAGLWLYQFAPVLHPLIAQMLAVLFQLNLMLGLFNLVPALPMDGGRVFRGLLALKYSHLRATQIASKIGKLLAVVGGIWGIYNSQWMLVLIAFFIYSAAGQEERVAFMREAHKRSQQGGGPFGSSPFGQKRGFYVYRESDQPQVHSDDWTDEEPKRTPPKTVEGGKVEVISRKLPK